MKKLITLLLLAPLAWAFQSTDCPNPKVFVYNAKKGVCENCKGLQGYNDFQASKIRKTKNAECMDLSGQQLVYLLDTSKIEGFMEAGYNKLEAYNFKGSKFEGAKLFFNDISKSSLEGADLSKIQFGYAWINGKTDAFTKFPSFGCEKIKGDSIDCSK